MTRADSQQRFGFTLVELLVTVAIIALLASLLLPTLSRAKERAREIQCANNVRQVGLAFHLYLGDFNDTFPAAGGGRLPEDWIYYGPLSPGPTSASPMVKYLSRGTNVLRCPSDQSFKAVTNLLGAYPFSYGLNDGNTAGGIQFNIGSGRVHSMQGIVEIHTPEDQGMASYYEAGPTHHFRFNMIRSPARKIMIAEARRPQISSNLNPSFNVQFYDLEGSSWWPSTPLATYHGKKGVTFVADGHVEKFTPQEGMQEAHGFALAP